MAASGTIKGNDFVSTLARGLEVIKAFNRDRPQLSVSDAAAATGLSRAAARRILLTLTHLGFARQVGESFALAPQVMELGYSYVASWRVAEIVRPSLAKLVETYGENSSFGIFDRDEIVVIARVEARRILRSIAILGGSRTPVAVGSMGRVLLADMTDAEVDGFLDRMPLQELTERTVIDRAAFKAVLAQVRQDGFCIVDGEYELGLIAIAAPIHDRHGKVIAAINFGAPTVRMTPETMLATLKDPLVAMGKEISRLLDLAGVPLTDPGAR